MDSFPVTELKRGYVYSLRSRNLHLGVFDGQRGFIGIREKFGAHYLFREYLADGGDFGTVTPLAEIGPLPEGVEIRENTDTVDQRNGRPVAFDRPVAGGGRGWYYRDTDEADQDIRAVSSTYQPLYAHLDSLDTLERES
jgi:hypothetical protein